MQGHSYLVKTVLELYNVGDKMSQAFKDSPGNPLGRLPPVICTHHFPLEVGAVGVFEPAESGVEGAVAAAVGAGLEGDVVEGDVAAVPPRLVRLVLGNRLENHLGKIW